ncbi:aminomethyltransferase family protein [Desulfogranum mediterraneum]|uniref:aminomethyltransferase family protein n=1 Tax=Desulfogranum mediterraneum TaxID=160661 RepID=UPI000419E2B3|nr:glycine cleavage system protein T [Desulfogranum mediterraneum]
MKTTPLHNWHVAQGANMGTFAAYEMPLWYPAGAKAEHLAVITAAGLFDTSHMAVLTIQGPGARALLQRCLSKDLDTCIGKDKTPLVAGRCVYGIFLSPLGGVIDDAIVYQFTATQFMLVVNAGMGATIAAHLREYSGDEQVTVDDLTDQVGKMDLQGPAAGRILAKIIKDPAALFRKMIYFSFKGSFDQARLATAEITLKDDTPLMVSRTGYTGEFGFELFVAPEHIAKLWQQLLEAGRDEGLISCGLAARDSLRSGAGLPLSHQDIGDWPFTNNPWLFTLPWDADGSGFSKEFIGRAGLEQSSESSWTLPFAGYDLRKIPLGKESRVTDLDGTPIGVPLTCTTDMAIDRLGETIVSLATPSSTGRPEPFSPRGLCCGFVKVNSPLAVGSQVLLTDGKRKLKVEIRNDIRPDRTARKPIAQMVSSQE